MQDEIDNRADGVGAKGTTYGRYFGIDNNSALTALQEKSFALLGKMTDGKTAEITNDAFTRQVAQIIGHEVITPFDPTPSREDLQAFEENMDSVTDLCRFLDGEKRRQDNFNDFLTITGKWRRSDVGPIRALYFFTILAAEYPDSADLLQIGGLPPSRRKSLGRGTNYLLSGVKVGPHVLDWLAYDAFLSDTLRQLGVSWLDVEDAMTSAFIKSLPPTYQKLLKHYAIPDGMAIALWRHDLERWQRVERDGERIVKKLDELSWLLKRFPQGNDFDHHITQIRQTAEPASWTHLVASDLPTYGKLKPSNPTVRAVYTSLADSLASKIGRQSLKNRPANDAPQFVHSIFDRQAGGGEKRQPKQAREFWMLCADLLFHIPVIRGVSGSLQLESSSTSSSFHTQNAIRLIVSRS